VRKLTAILMAAALLTGCQNDEGSLTMVTEATFPPYEFLRGREIVGVDVEICRAVADRLGKAFRVESVTFDAVIPALVSGKADLAAAGLTVTEDRTKSVDFSVPYMKTGVVIIYRKDRPFLTGAACRGRRIGVQGGTTADEYTVSVLKQEPERFASFPEGVAALQSGRCDLVLCDAILARQCVLGERDLALSDFITTEEYAVAVRKGQPELLRTINDTITELKENGSLAKWIADFTAESNKLKDK